MAQAQNAVATAPRAPRTGNKGGNKGGKGKGELVVQTAGNVTGPGGKQMPEVTAQNQNPPEVVQEQRQGERRQQQQDSIARFVNQTMETTAAHAVELSEEDRKRIAFEEEAKALAEKYGIKNIDLNALNGTPAKAQAAQRAPRNADNKNGITRPGKGTQTGKVWEAADEISLSKKGEPATIAEVKAKLAGSVNDATTRTQYARWRGYNGIKGRVGPQGGNAQQNASPEGQDDGIAQAYEGTERRSPDRRYRTEEPAAQ